MSLTPALGAAVVAWPRPPPSRRIRSTGRTPFTLPTIFMVFLFHGTGLPGGWWAWFPGIGGDRREGDRRDTSVAAVADGGAWSQVGEPPPPYLLTKEAAARGVVAESSPCRPHRALAGALRCRSSAPPLRRTLRGIRHGGTLIWIGIILSRRAVVPVLRCVRAVAPHAVGAVAPRRRCGPPAADPRNHASLFHLRRWRPEPKPTRRRA